MNLTHKIREELAMKLTVKAITPNVQPLADRLKEANKEFWRLHAEQVKAVLPVPMNKWNDLIAAGVLRATSTVFVVTETAEGESSNSAVCVYDKPYTRQEWYISLLKEPALSPLGHLVNPRHSSVICFEANYGGAVPHLNNMNTLRHGTPLAENLRSIDRDSKAFFNGAYEFYCKVTDVLASCRTKKQLEEIFPEAAALLPAPQKKSNIVPVELANSVRDMLSKGVPA